MSPLHEAAETAFALGQTELAAVIRAGEGELQAQIASEREQRAIAEVACKSAVEIYTRRLQEAEAAADRLRAELAALQWQPIETAPKDMGARLFLSGGIVVQGFVDATGQLLVQNERRGWRQMRIRPTHHMPLPPAPKVV